MSKLLYHVLKISGGANAPNPPLVARLLTTLPQMAHNLCGARHFQVEKHW